MREATTLGPIWHPCSQMKDYETFKPLEIVSAKGSYVELSDGHRLIDAISSWWCKTLGHNHPQIKKALLKQIDQFEHVILANTTNETIEQLSHKLTSLHPQLNKVFYASDGSSAVEIALKMSLHARQIQGEPHRDKFISLSNDYHGETIGALSVSDLGLYKKHYKKVCFETFFIDGIPYVSGANDPLWDDCESHWQHVEKQLEPLANTATAIIVEPILQGVCAMLVYSADFLKRIAAWAKKHNVHLIADEILTGIGRTGSMLASDHAQISPDFVCLGKGLTSGWLPMSCVLMTDDIYNTFYGDYGTGKDFLHSNTYAGNALAACTALETIRIVEAQNLCARATVIGEFMQSAMSDIAKQTGVLTNLRGIGSMVAADLVIDDPKRRLGYEIYQEAIKLGAYLRPLGNTIYWLPPITTEIATLEALHHITLKSIEKCV